MDYHNMGDIGRDDDEDFAGEENTEDSWADDDEPDSDDDWEEWRDEDDEPDVESSDSEEGGDWHGGWPLSDEEEDRSVIDMIRDWFDRLRGKEEELSDDEQRAAHVEAARDRVEHYHSSGAADRHRAALADDYYRGSLEYTFASNTERLESFLESYAQECRRVHSDFIGEEVWENRIATLFLALESAEKTAKRLQDEEADVERRWAKGELSRSAYDDLLHVISVKLRKAITRLDMGGQGMTHSDIGDVADGSSHILGDTFSDDGGAARRKIADKIRSMPRGRALAIIDMAVQEGVITQEIANYLTREYVRTR